MTKNFVFDTNVLISAFLNQNSKPFLSFKLAKNLGEIFVSKATFDEFKEVLFRDKFDKYLSKEKRVNILSLINKEVKFIIPKKIIKDCRDPKDDKFLELALECNAACIVSGDPDLLILHPYFNIPILNPADFLEQF